MAYTCLFDQKLFNIKHERNCVGLNSSVVDVSYHRNPPRASKKTQPPTVQVYVIVSHHLVPHHILEPSSTDGTIVHVLHQEFTWPLATFEDGPARLAAYKHMLSRFAFPFKFSPAAAASQLAASGGKITSEAVAKSDSRGVKELRIHAFVVRLTFLDSELYESLRRKTFAWTVWRLKTFNYGGSNDRRENMCSICLKEYRIGTHVSGLPCSHCFHQNCITKWFKGSKTCPVCRSIVNVLLK